MFGFGRAGGMRTFSLLANEWIKSGHEVTFLCHNSTPDPYYPTTANILYYDDDGRLCPESNEISKKLRSVYFGAYCLYRALNQLEHKFDVAIANFWPTAFSLRYSRLVAKKFYYIQAYEPGFFTGSSRYERMARVLAKRSYNLGLNMIVNARTYYDYANIASSHLALPPVDLSIFHPKSNPGVINNSRPIKIGMIGRNVGWKGGDYVLRAFEILRSKNIGVDKYHLHVAFGDDEVSKRPGVYKNCPQNDTELAAFYRDMDIFIAVPTLQYGAVHYPVVEALASGTPLITTGYYPATSANSWLVEPHSPDAIVSAIESIDEESNLAIARSARGLIDPQEHCSIQVARQFLKYL